MFLCSIWRGGRQKGSVLPFITSDFRSLQRKKISAEPQLAVSETYRLVFHGTYRCKLTLPAERVSKGWGGESGGGGGGGCFFSLLVSVSAAELQTGRDVPLPSTPPPSPPFSLDGDPPPAAMRTSRCSHLPGVPPERPRPPAPDGKTLPGGGSGGSPAGSCPQYVMQVSAKDGQLLSSVVRTLTTQRYMEGGVVGQDGPLPCLGYSAPSPAATRRSRGRSKGRCGGAPVIKPSS